MKTLLRSIALAFFTIQFSFVAHATHNRAGEIIIEQIKDENGIDCTNRVKATIITYTKTSSVAADRDTLTICWGDNNCEEVHRQNGGGNPLDNDIKHNIYVAYHTYSGPGHYIVSMTDPNRNGGILNVNPPGSENVQFHLQTGFTLFGQSCNSTPILQYKPVDYACIGQPFVHNPGAYDPDGDSLSYELIVPMQEVNTPVPNYIWPNYVPMLGDPNNVPTGTFDINMINGTVEWRNPVREGEYNFAMIIISWRNGLPIDTTVRDMQILVFDCDDNQSPQITTIDKICVVAGDVVEFEVVATDPNLSDKVKLTAEGSPFTVAISPADDVEIWRPDGNPSATYDAQPVIKKFRWQTACEHISNLPYTVVFKAEDDFFLSDPNLPNSTGLAFLKAVQIKVVGPPPLDVQAEPTSDHIDVSWESPYKCEDTQNNYFFGFSVWRREGSDNCAMDSCMPGLAGCGYTHLANTVDIVNGRYQFTDTEVERGRTYCYRILGRFAKRTSSGSAYNLVESLKSERVCVQLSRDVPLLTNVSIVETATSSGQIQVKWTKPLAEDLDTLLNPGPYKYQLQRGTGLSPADADFATIATFDSPTFWQLNQLEYLDQDASLNTKDNPYSYRIAFYVNGENEPLGFAPPASSVFLSISPTDNQNDLSWEFDVPWVNYEYTIFRKNSQGTWDSITLVTEPMYADTGLLNGREYCYYVRAAGSYGIANVPSPLFNDSQESCSVPVDNVAPCPPELGVRNICNENVTCQEGEVLFNTLEWINPMELCAKTDDVVYYKIYYAPFEGDEFTLIGSTDDSGTTTFIHEPERGIAGCYAVTALDTFENESDFSPIICVDNCPSYLLPNAFTPNNDGANELFEPYPFCFIESIDMNIFNRWGELVYQTSDPNINWKGENLKGKRLPSGTYYYTCKVYEQRVTGIVPAPEVLSGYIDIIR